MESEMKGLYGSRRYCVLYKLMIVDDDYWTREYLKKHIPWDRYKISQVCEAESGEEALLKMSQSAADILIADIKMPNMDGIELAEAAIKKNKDIKIILLSGLKDFEYARKAISLGVVEYIVKPVQEDALEDVVLRVVAKLDEASHARTAEISKSRVAAQAAPLLKEKLLMKLLTAGMDTEEIESDLQRLAPDLKMTEQSIVIAWEIDHYRNMVNKLGMEKTAALKKNLRNTAQETMPDFSGKNVLDGEDSRFIVILSHECCKGETTLTDAALSYCRQLSRQIAEAFDGATVSCGIGGISSGINHLCSSYQQACRTLLNKFFLGNGRVMAFHPDDRPPAAMEDYAKKYGGALIDAVSFCDREGLENLLIRLKSDLVSHKGIDHNYIRHSLLILIEKLAEAFQAGRITGSEEICDIYVIGMEVNQCETLDEILEVLRGFLTDMLRCMESQKRNNTQKLADEVAGYIRRYYNQDLYVDEIARMFNVHPSYLSRTFKKERGENLLQFIMKVKIEKSKQLLCNPGLKITEIASFIGYENERTFTRVFKKLEGMTPTDYREKAGADGCI